MKYLNRRITLCAIATIFVLSGCSEMNDSVAAKSEPNQPVTKQHATEIARRKIAEMSRPDSELVVQEEKTQEKQFGWVFFWTTKKYLETGDRKYLMPGNGPLVVNREDGSAQFLPTSLPPARAVEEYQKLWHKKKE